MHYLQHCFRYIEKAYNEKTIILGIGLFIIETIQAFINILAQYQNRIADIDDIILNSIGVMLETIIVYSWIRKMFLVNDRFRVGKSCQGVDFSQ